MIFAKIVTPMQKMEEDASIQILSVLSLFSPKFFTLTSLSLNDSKNISNSATPITKVYQNALVWSRSDLVRRK